MDLENLRQIGLNSNESIVYLALLKSGKVSAGELAQKSGLHRAVVYDNLERLVEKGLVSFISEGKRKLFHPNSPKMLIDLLERERKELDTKIEIANKIQKEAELLVLRSKTPQDASMLRGKRGVMLVYEDILKVGKSYNAFGAPKASVDIMGETFWKNIDVKTRDKKIRINLIFNESLRDYGGAILRELKHINLKYIDHGFDALTQTIIYGAKVAIIVWTEKPIITLIEDENVVESYNSYFNLLWGIAKD